MNAGLPALASRLDEGVRSLLRGAGFGPRATSVPVGELAVLVGLGGFVFGAVMGGFSGRPLQMLYSGLKVPLLLGAATALCLPGFYAVNCVLGLRGDFAAAVRGVLAAQATLAVTLASCAPIELLAYASSPLYGDAVRSSGVCFLLATLAAQLTLGRHYRPLVARDPRHRHGRRLWALLYVFVAIQIAWVLRPFVGAPTLPPSFLRRNAWSNAYVVVARDVLSIGR